ncbi:MAG TPA: SDR family NAD(P)-dependent oxidoreductase [Solirubrobacteraceae bacterium]|nr:SDR family NAD(P)-dependent oxidoreductase [Solirubrobacteraceae bacterium]
MGQAKQGLALAVARRPEQHHSADPGRTYERREAILMSTTTGKTALVTGANAGLGKDIARQLALRPEIANIYLACRNRDKAIAARTELEAETGRRIFDIAVMDVSDPDSVRAGLAGVDGTVDVVVMNAGGMGGKTPMALTADGVTYMFAQNVLGHVVLLETLLAEDRLGEVAVFAGSEAARGLPKMGFKRPSFASKSADELATVIDGSFFAGTKPDVNLAYGQAKLLGALWMAYVARRYPDRRFVTMSPGNTTGTHAPDDLALPFRFAAKHVMPHLGISHSLDVGAKRLVDGATDPTLFSGKFYASAAGKMKGPIVDQTNIYPDLADSSFQDNANEAIHRFITSKTVV